MNEIDSISQPAGLVESRQSGRRMLWVRQILQCMVGASGPRYEVGLDGDAAGGDVRQ